jgi:hypothetical protein
MNGQVGTEGWSSSAEQRDDHDDHAPPNRYPMIEPTHSDLKRGPNFPGDAQKLWIIDGKWKNFGETPTRNLRTYNMITIDPTKAKPIQFVDFGKLGLKPTISIIAPHEEISGMSIGLSSDALNDASTGKMWIILKGVAVYQDIYDAPHITMRCQVLNLPHVDFGRIEKGRQLPATAEACADYNCADKECAKYKPLIADLVPPEAYEGRPRDAHRAPPLPYPPP